MNNSTSAPLSSGQKPGVTPATGVPTVAASNPPDNARATGVAPAASSPVLFAMKTFLESEQPAKGVVIVANSDPTVSAVAMAAVADGIVCDHAIADHQVRHVSKVTLLHPSGPRGSVPLKAFASSAIKAKLHEVPISHCIHFNPLAPEGVHILVNQLKLGECVFVQVEYKDLTRDAAIVALAELNANVEQLDALLVLFIFHTKKQDVGWLQERCGVFVEVCKCEPGPNAQAAVVLTNVSLSYWHPHGIGRVMVEAFLNSDNVWTYSSEPFIAGRAIIRLSWHLRFKGVTVEQIAKIIDIHKSNVSRGLDSLLIPPDNAVGLVPPRGSRRRWISRYPEVENLWLVNKLEQNVAAGNAPKMTSVTDRVPHATPNAKP